MAKKSIKKNYILNVSYQILALITPLITTPYVSRILGADGIGTYSYIDSIASYFVLFATMGITTFGQREISYVQENKEKRSQLFWETKLLSVYSCLIALCIYLVFALLQDNKFIFLLFSINIIAVLFDVTWFFQGMEEFGIIVFRNVIFKVLNIAYIFVLIHKKSDLILYIAGITCFALISNISLWTRLLKYLNKPIWKKLHPFKNIKIVLSLFIPTIAIQIYTVLDKTMIGIITKDTFENGYYEQALKISKMVLTLVTALGTVMIPRIGYHFANKENEQVKDLMYRGYRFVWFLGMPLCFGLIGISSNLVPWFYGNGYDKVVPLLCALSFLILAIGINNVTGMQYLIPTGRQNTFTKTVILGAIINFCINIVLIPKLQSIGAAIASVVAETIIAIVQIYIVRNELSPTEIAKSSIHYIIAASGMLTVLIIEGNLLDSSIIHTVIMIISGGSVYFVILLLEKDNFFIAYSNYIISKLRNKFI